MERSGTKGWMVASVIMLALVFVLALTLTIVLLDKDGQDGSEAEGLGVRLNQLEEKLEGASQVASDAGNQVAAKPGSDTSGKKGTDQGNNGGSKNQGQQATNNNQQVIEALGYNYASSERPDLNWQVTDSNVSGDTASVTVEASFAQGMETRTYDFKKQNGQWVLTGGGAGSAQAPPGP
jgi:hypothetical protein